MDKRIRRLALVLLCAVLLTALPVTVSGQTVSYASPRRSESNPLYPWAAEQGGIRTEALPTVASDGTEADYADSWDAALDELRTQLAAHAETAYFRYKGDGTLAAQFNAMTENEAYAFVLEQFYAALEHTGQPKEGDYMRWHYSSVSYGFSWYGYTNGDFFYTFEYTPAYLTTLAQEQAGDAAVAALLDQLDVYDASDYEKVDAVYDWICSNVTYDYIGLKNDDKLCHSAYAAIVNKTAVCQGYATLMYRMLLELDVDNRLIASQTHGWNIVKLGDLYYNCDSTWDATETEYLYFLGGADAFDHVSDHVRESQYDTADFHAAYPMALDAYTPGQENIAVSASGVSLLLEDEVCGKLYFVAENMPQAATVTQRGMTVYDADPAQAAQVLDVITTGVETDTAGEYAAMSEGLPAKEMGRELWLEPYVMLSDGSMHRGEAVPFSVQDYAQEILNGSYTANAKALVAAMLQYGAAAQTFFDYETGALVDSGLTEAQAAAVLPYSSDMLRVPQAPGADKCAAFEKTEDGFVEKAVSTTLGSAFALNCYATPENTPDEGSFMLYAWTQSTAQEAEALTKDNADWTACMGDEDGDGRWLAALEGIAAKEIDDAMLICMTYTSGGQTYCTGVIPYSLQAYCERLLSLSKDAQAQALAKAMVVYGYHADAYFS